MIEVKNLRKVYGKKDSVFEALKGVSFSVPDGATVAIIGKSGSGKSTLMHIIGGLDRPTEGDVVIDGQNIGTMKRKQIDHFRAHDLGFVFQSFFVEGNQTCYQNVALPLEITQTVLRGRKALVESALERVELSDKNPDHVQKAFDLYYEFDYDLGVRDMEDTWHYLEKIPECNGKVGAVGYCLGGKLCYLMCCRTDIDCAVAYYGTYIEHRIKEVKNLHRPFVLHMAMKDRWVQAEVNDMLERRLSPNPLVTIHKYPGADHAFARHGGKTYSKPEADRALALTVDFFKKHLG